MPRTTHLTAVPDAPPTTGANPLAPLSRLAGTALGRAKPLHPRGAVLDGVLTRTGGSPPSGVPWLDDHGIDHVVVRLSRAAGLPRRLPDVHGLAVRVPLADGCADLLLSSAGLGRLTRFLPVPGAHERSRPFSSLMPYRGPHGPVLLGAVPEGRSGFGLLWATPRSGWVPFGRLTVPGERTADADVSFDSFLHPLPGLTTYGWTRALREPAYRAARERTGRSVHDPVAPHVGG